MTVKTILFDLDGTLTDPVLGITNSVAFALQRFGIEVEDRTTLHPFIGPPLIDSFMKYFGFTYDQAHDAVEYYREYFSDRGIFENRVYDGIPAMLTTLHEAGATLLVASSKPEVYVRRILDHFDLSHHFLFIGGSELDHRRLDKHEVIEYVFESAGIIDRSTAIMVGDRSHDVLGGQRSGLPAVGVTFGYGSREELTKAGAAYVVDTVEELTNTLLSLL